MGVSACLPLGPCKPLASFIGSGVNPFLGSVGSGVIPCRTLESLLGTLRARV